MVGQKILFDSQNQLRAGWRILLYVASVGLLLVAVVLTFDEVARVIPSKGSSVAQTLSIGMYVSLLAAVLLPAFFMLRVFDHRPVSVLGFDAHGRMLIEVGEGLTLAFLMISLIFVVEWLAGWADIRWAGLRPQAAYGFTIYYVLFFAFAGAFEETLLRGYAFQVLVQATGKVAAVCISSCAFALAHVANPGVGPFAVVNTILAGIWLSSAYLKTRSLWLPTSLHMSWNFTQGFVYGCPVSGMSLSHSLFELTLRDDGWLTGGDYGPEGGVLSPIILILGTAYVLRSKRVRPREEGGALWD